MRLKKLPNLSGLLLVSLLVSCSKSDLESNNQQPQNSIEQNANRVTTLTTTQRCFTLTFDNIPALVNVTQVAFDEGDPVAVTTSTSVASLFNTSAPPAINADMGSPNVFYGGPGIANPANISGGATNTTALGNVLILQNPAVAAYPDEADFSVVQTIDLNFPRPVTATSIQVIDVETLDENEGGNIVLLDANGLVLNTVPIPETFSNGVATINLGNTANVKTIRLQVMGSMGFDNLAFCVQRYSPCTYTQGYWKNHPEAWTGVSLYLGNMNNTYTQAQLLEILKTPVRGNGLVSLAHQLIAAKLNAWNGGNTSVITADIAAADAIIGALRIPPVGSGYLSPSTTSALTGKLSSYNEGTIGPGHCD